MKKSEKLLDAIGRIDDKYVEEAALAGKRSEDTGARTAKKEPENGRKTGTDRERDRKGKRKKTPVHRWQGALAACAVLAVCIGVSAFLQKSGVLLSPFGGSKASQENEAMDTAEAVYPENAADSPAGTDTGVTGPMEKAAGQETGLPEQGSPDRDEKLDGAVRADSRDGEAQTGENEGEPAPASLEMLPQGLQGRAAFEPEEAPVTVSDVEYSAGKVTFTLVNEDTENAVTDHRAYYLERLTDEFWQEVPLNQEVEWEESEYTIPAGGSGVETVEVGNLYGELEAGEYRLVRECSLTGDGGMEQYSYYVEFGVGQ